MQKKISVLCFLMRISGFLDHKLYFKLYFLSDRNLKLILILEGENTHILGTSIFESIFQSARIRIKLPAWLLKTNNLSYNRTLKERKRFQKSLEKYLDMLIIAIREYQLWNVTAIQVSKNKWRSFDRLSLFKMIMKANFQGKSAFTHSHTYPPPTSPWQTASFSFAHSFVHSLLNKHISKSPATYKMSGLLLWFRIIHTTKLQFVSSRIHKEMLGITKWHHVVVILCQLDQVAE